LIRQKHLRLAELPPLLIEAGAYCNLLREARDVFVEGYFYACVAMCGISLERFQRDKATSYGAGAKDKIWQIRKLLCTNQALQPETIVLCEKMATMRNNYAHGHGLTPREDAVQALRWLHQFISRETDLMQDYTVIEGVLHRKRGCSV